MKKTISFFLLFISCGFLNDLFSQNLNLLSEKVFWIKSEKAVFVDSIQNQDYLNFNESIDFSDKNILKKHKNIFSDKGSLFIVFRSKSKDELEILALKNRDFNVNIFNKKIVSDKESLIDEYKASTGVIVNFICNKNSSNKRKGHLILNEILFDKSNKQLQIFEIIFISENISNKEKSIIESYLSIKYGVSLEQNKNYLISNGDTIWNAKKDIDFTNRVTAIGKDSILDLKQIRSKNSLDDGLSINVLSNGEDNKTNEFTDKSFIIWGDNNKKNSFKKDNLSNKKMLERVWRLKTFSNESSQFSAKIVFDRELINLQDDSNDKQDFIWLAIDSTGTNKIDFKTAKYYKAIVDEKDQIVFNAIKLNPNSQYLFSLVKGKDTDITEINQESKVDNDIAEGFRIYPNPIYKGQLFSIDFNLFEQSEVITSIYDINGKLIKSKNLGIIKSYMHQETIYSSGIFLIQVSINGKIQSTKLIVK